ncbi:uncharacterized protein FIBRA_01508 [Fibroporia radiculosa]|uniref:Methyltransferase domain-containing protein n=1 Tax=Fibroporia radiculosa TaxID=599839 RepID=J4GKF9_9APHY|nr:uncharacterized protein FIBRA_01508 [Fibroporia radiculosa]CCL99490.1 predicted protein [Fibroporia radiculosa]
MEITVIRPATEAFPEDIDRIQHVGRVYQSFPGSEYVLPSDGPERDRLALQHRLLAGTFENRIMMPEISFEAGDRILDSGCGSGVWLLDAINQVPNAVVLEGIDIESRLFPMDSKLIATRGNMNFSIGTITKLPSEWTATFTLVHQRLLIAALRAEEWGQAIKEMMRVLVPGGWVQLGEAGAWQAGKTTEKHRSLVDKLFVKRGLLLDCSDRIPSMLRAAGFSNVHIDKRPISLGSWAGEVGIEARENFMGVFRGMKSPVLNAGGLGYVNTEEEWESLLDAVEEEWDNTEGAEMSFFIFYAQKPLF